MASRLFVVELPASKRRKQIPICSSSGKRRSVDSGGSEKREEIVAVRPAAILELRDEVASQFGGCAPGRGRRPIVVRRALEDEIGPTPEHPLVLDRKPHEIADDANGQALRECFDDVDLVVESAINAPTWARTPASNAAIRFGRNEVLKMSRSASCRGGSIVRNEGPVISSSSSTVTPPALENVSQSRNAAWTSAKRESA